MAPTPRHINRHTLRSKETRLESVYPTHYLDTLTFKIFAPTPGVVTKHGHFSFKWDRSQVQTNQWSSYRRFESHTFISMDDGANWLPISRWYYGKRYEDSLHKEDVAQRLTNQLHEELKAIRTAFQKKRTNQLAKERRRRIKAKQDELGISKQEAAKLLAEERRKEKQFRSTRKDVKRTNRIIAVAPLVRDLKNEIDAFLAQLEKDPSKVNITYVSRAKRDINSAISLISRWNKEK